MAKNKNLSDLIGGFVSNPSEKDLSENLSHVPQQTLNDDKDSAIVKRGRPKKMENENGVRTSVILDKVLLAKLKYVSMMEGVQMKSVIVNLLSKYLDKWEKENGEIRLPKSLLK